MKYTICVEETVSRVFTVEADSGDEAMDRAEEIAMGVRDYAHEAEWENTNTEILSVMF